LDQSNYLANQKQIEANKYNPMCLLDTSRALKPVVLFRVPLVFYWTHWWTSSRISSARSRIGGGALSSLKQHSNQEHAYIGVRPTLSITLFSSFLFSWVSPSSQFAICHFSVSCLPCLPPKLNLLGTLALLALGGCLVYEGSRPTGQSSIESRLRHN